MGGVVSVVLRNVPIGLGEPCFDKLEVRARVCACARVRVRVRVCVHDTPASAGSRCVCVYACMRVRVCVTPAS